MRPHRKKRLASVIREIVSDTIARRLHDPRIVPLTTVTRVEMSGDLLISRVYLSVQGGDAAEKKTIAGLRHAAGYIQRIVARELSVRQCPELRFEIDETVKGVRKTMQLLQENRREHPELFESSGADNGDPPSIRAAGGQVDNAASDTLTEADE